MSTINPANITTQKVNVEAEYQALITGINALLPGIDPFVFANLSLSRADLIKSLQRRIDAAEATKAARMAYHVAVAEERAVAAIVSPQRASLKVYLQGRFGKTNSQLQAFGFTPNRIPSKSVAAKATGLTTARATRVARNTLGKKQKSGIHGTVPTAASPPESPTASTPPAPPTAPGATTTTEAPVAPTV
jgi:hypothetical protein